MPPRYICRLKVEFEATDLDEALARIPEVIATERLTEPVVTIVSDRTDQWDVNSPLLWCVRIDGEAPGRKRR